MSLSKHILYHSLCLCYGVIKWICQCLWPPKLANYLSCSRGEKTLFTLPTLTQIHLSYETPILNLFISEGFSSSDWSGMSKPINVSIEDNSHISSRRYFLSGFHLFNGLPFMNTIYLEVTTIVFYNDNMLWQRNSNPDLNNVFIVHMVPPQES